MVRIQCRVSPMAEVAYAAGPALQGPRAPGQLFCFVLPNCEIHVE